MSSATKPRACETPPRLPDFGLRRLAARLAGRNMLAFADQATVSGTNFATTILVGWHAAEGELGLYVLGFSIVLLALCIQQALVIAPYTIFANRLEGDARADYAGSILVHQVWLSLLTLASLGVAAAVALGVADGSFAALLLALALAAPCALLREFARRVAFAHLAVGQALAVDIATAGLQLAVVGLLVWSDAVSALTAHLASGGAALLAAGGWLALHRASFRIHLANARAALGQSWRFGRWLLGGNIAALTHAYLMHWALLFYLGALATSLFAACATIVDFSNLFVLGIGNVAAPRAAHAFADFGRRGVRRVVAQVTLVLAILMTGFCLAIVVLGETTLATVFRIDDAAQPAILLVLAVAGLFTALGVGSSNGLWALERTPFNFAASALSMVVTLGSAPVLIGSFGVIGAAWSHLLGTAAGMACRCLAFVLVSRPTSQEACDA